jgi:hypothetical protein
MEELLHLSQGGHLVHRDGWDLKKRGAAVTKPISDKAEIALEYPDKLYVGTSERSSRFETHVDQTGIALILERPGAEMSGSRPTCTSTSVCSLTFCVSWLRRLAAFQRTTSYIVISSRKRSPSYTRLGRQGGEKITLKIDQRG